MWKIVRAIAYIYFAIALLGEFESYALSGWVLFISFVSEFYLDKIQKLLIISADLHLQSANHTYTTATATSDQWEHISDLEDDVAKISQKLEMDL